MPKQKTPESVTAIFQRRSRSIYAGMVKRGPVHFNLEQFRAWLLASFTAGGSAYCCYSGDLIVVENFCVDHRTPLSRGGGETRLDNLALCSEQENLRKGNMTAEEYQKFRAHVHLSGYHLAAIESIWRRLQVGDVQRFSYFRRQRKGQK